MTFFSRILTWYSGMMINFVQTYIHTYIHIEILICIWVPITLQNLFRKDPLKYMMFHNVHYVHSLNMLCPTGKGMYTYAYTNIRTCVHTYIYIYIYTFKYCYVYGYQLHNTNYIYIYTHTYVHTYIRTYIYTSGWDFYTSKAEGNTGLYFVRSTNATRSVLCMHI